MRIILCLASFLCTFSLSGQTWNQISTQGNIPARANASMIYHPDEHAVYVFGVKLQEGNKMIFGNWTWKRISGRKFQHQERFLL